MNKDYYKPYEGRDIQILDQHAANTIAEDHLTFPYQLLDHLAHVLMLKEQEIISPEDAALILRAVLKLRREGPGIDPRKHGLTDLYSNVEEWVIDQVGIQVGGKLHTGRSRNDMNPAIERMYIRKKLLGFHGMLVNSMDATSTLDYAYEPACAMAIFINNVGRVTESLLLWNLNEVVRSGFSTVTDLADEMVRSMGLSFSAAKKIVGRMVVIAHDEGIACTQIDTALVARTAKEVLDIVLQMPQELITNALDPVQNVTRRHIIGGPSPERVQEAIDNGQMQVEQLKTWRLAEEARLLAVEDALVAAAEAVVQANQK